MERERFLLIRIRIRIFVDLGKVVEQSTNQLSIFERRVFHGKCNFRKKKKKRKTRVSVYRN